MRPPLAQTLQIKCMKGIVTFSIGFETTSVNTDPSVARHPRSHAGSLQEGLLTESDFFFFVPVRCMTAHYLEQTAVFAED